MERRAILDTVKQKIDADYRSRLGQWEEEFYQDDVGFLEHLHDVCVAQIVHDNLMKCGDRYDAGYLAALAEEKDPLDMLAKAYEDGGFFAIAPYAQQALDALKKSPDSGSSPMGKDEIDEKLSLLDSRLAMERAWLKREWSTFDFDLAMSRAVEYDTLWELYHTYQHEQGLYSPEDLALLASSHGPIRDTMDWVVISRDLLKESLDELQQVFPQLYPDIQIGETAPFRVKPELKEAYQEFRTKVCGDFYSAGILRYAERWAAMMEDKIEAGATVAEAAEATHHLADTEHISGFMYGQAVNLLSGYWEHGDELRQWQEQQNTPHLTMGM